MNISWASHVLKCLDSVLQGHFNIILSHLDKLELRILSINPKYLQPHIKTINTVICLQLPLLAEPYRVQSQTCVCAAMRTHTNRASVLLPGAVGAFHWKTLCFAWEKLKRSFSMTDPEGGAEITHCFSGRAQMATMLILMRNFQWKWMKTCLWGIRRCRKRRGTRENSFMRFHRRDFKILSEIIRVLTGWESFTWPLLTLMFHLNASACWVIVCY